MTAVLTAAAKQDIMLDVTDWLSVTEAAKQTGYSAYHIRKLCREGTLTTVQKGLMYLIDPESLDEYVAKVKRAGTYKHDWRTWKRKKKED